MPAKERQFFSILKLKRGGLFANFFHF